MNDNAAPTSSPKPSRNSAVSKINQIISLVFSVLEVVLTIRLVLALFGANPANQFAKFIYNLSNPFVAPFRGLFGFTFHAGVSHFEFETLFAIFMYAILGWLVRELVNVARRERPAA